MTTNLKRITRLRRLIRARLEKGEDEELKIFEKLTEDRFDEAIVVHTMQTELRTIDRVFDSLSRSRIPEVNDFPGRDPKIRYFSDLWFFQRTTARIEQKEQVGLAYISKYLGLNDKVARAFVSKTKEGRRAYYAIGIARLQMRKTNPFFFRKSTARNHPKYFRPNIAEFWQKVREIFPDSYRKEDIEFLSELSFMAVENFMLYLEPTLAEDASINRSLRSNEAFFFTKEVTV